AKAVGTPCASVKADILRRRETQRALRFSPLIQSVSVHGKSYRPYVLGRPGWLSHPAAGAVRQIGRLPDRLLHPDPIGRFVHDPGVLALQPVVPPAQGLLEKADGRSRLGEMRVLMRPRANQSLARRFQAGKQARDGIGIAVRPASDRIDRAFD